jgi:hypothetical protein
MTNALIGFSGFVGSTLLRQTIFDKLYRSTNIDEVDGQVFDIVVCAAAPAQKWRANKEPEADRQKIDTLISHLKTFRCRKFILISTVEIFHDARDVDEETVVEESGLHAYGLNRLYLEKFISDRFLNSMIVRLPGLVGPGLRKNIIFDFLNKNNLHMIESRSVFQFYPMINLWYDIQIALKANLKLVHLTSAPLRVSDISYQGFGRPFEHTLSGLPIEYNMRTKFAHLFDSKGAYQYSTRETIQAIRAYAQSEPITMISEQGHLK